MPMTLPEIAEAMRDIDICTLATRTVTGAITARPMSNNREVDFDGDAWFFTVDSTSVVPEIEAEPRIGLTYQRSGGIKGLIGMPGPFFHVEARALLIRGKAAFAAHWHASLDAWFDQGVETPGLVLIHARAERIHYWDGLESGEIPA